MEILNCMINPLNSSRAALKLALGGIVAASLAVAGCRPDSAPKELERFRTVADFSLTERTEKTVTRADLKGKIVVVHFFFAGCSVQCETLGARMAQIQTATAKMDNVQLLSITVDPQSDNPERLRYYASRFNADAGRWLFLTGKRDDIYKLIQESFLQPAQGQAATGFVHSEKIVLVDQDGVVRAYYEGMESDVLPKVLAGIKQLQENAPKAASP
jgi:protein SCO1/2